VSRKAQGLARIADHHERRSGRKAGGPFDRCCCGPRVQGHLEKAGLTNVGQVMQRLAEGDEAMLSVEGIGPKALAEIKTQVEAKGLGFLPEVTPVQPEPVAPVEAAPAQVTAPVVEEIKPVAPEVVAPVTVAPVAPSAAVVTEPGQAVAEPVATAPVVATPVPAPIIEELLEDEDEEGGKAGGKKKDQKAKGRKLVFDERLGTVVAKRERKPGRVRDVWTPDEEE
jgi:hypothetical protein